MAFTDYTDLLIGVSDYTGRDDVAHLFGRFTALAETKLNRRLRVADMDEEISLTTDANGDATLPTDYIEAREVKDSNGRILRQASINALTRLYGNRSGTPTEFAIVGSVLMVKPTIAATFDMIYYEKIPSLETNGTNWLLTRAPDIYLYATALEVSAWARDAEGVSGARTLLDQSVSSLIVDDERARWSLGRVKLTGVNP